MRQILQTAASRQKWRIDVASVLDFREQMNAGAKMPST